MKYVLLSTLLLLLADRSWAQKTITLNPELGFNSFALRDESTSPMVYNGFGYSAGLSLNVQKKKKTVFHQLLFNQSFLSNRFDNKRNFWGASYRSFTFYHANRSTEKQLIFGWSNNNYFNIYETEGFNNYGVRFNYFTAFGPALYYAYPFELFNRQFRLEAPLAVQMLGFYVRPSYISSAPKGYLDPDKSTAAAFLSSVELFAPHQSWNLEVQPQLSFFFKSGNAVSITYRYEFMGIAQPELMMQSSGVWMVSLKTILK